MNIKLQPSTTQDLPWLEALRRVVYRDLFIATWGGWDEQRHRRHWSAFLEEGNIYIIKADGADAGMVQIIDQPTSIEIAEIQLLPDYQGQGIGSHVIRDIVTKAHENQKAATLSVGLKNTRAIKLYQRLGFTEADKTDTKLYFELVSSA